MQNKTCIDRIALTSSICQIVHACFFLFVFFFLGIAKKNPKKNTGFSLSISDIYHVKGALSIEKQSFTQRNAMTRVM